MTLTTIPAWVVAGVPSLGTAYIARMDGDDVIHTARLDLHHVRPAEYAWLAVDREDPRLWVDRGFSNPHRHLVDDPGPIPFRMTLIADDPQTAPLLLRMAVLRTDAVIIGSGGFHGRPDADGMIEIGVGIEPAFRGRGFAQELLHGLWSWVVEQPGVVRLRYTVSPGNAPSQAIIRKFGFVYVGTQLDEIDGVEDIYEMTAEEYCRRYV